MKSGSFIIWLVVLGVLFSLHGRAEPESKIGSTSIKQGLSTLADDNEASPLNEPLPPGDHKDQHGCYHSHAPFQPAVVGFLSQFFCSLYVSKVSSPIPSVHTSDISHPPRA